jgi:hypothetical protein
MKELYNQAKRKDSLIAVNLVFDFKLLTDDQKQNFDIERHAELIQGFLKEIGLSTEHELLGLAYHGTEMNPHYHALISGKNREGRFKLNDFLNPKNDKGYRSKQNMYDLQEKWGAYLKEHTYYKHKKKYPSVISWSDRVWRLFTNEQRSKSYELRQAEQNYHEAREQKDDPKIIKRLKNFIMDQLSDLMDVALDLDDDMYHEQKRKKKNAPKIGD